MKTLAETTAGNIFQKIEESLEKVLDKESPQLKEFEIFLNEAKNNDHLDYSTIECLVSWLLELSFEEIALVNFIL